MAAATPTFRSLRELAHRGGDGLDITLFWAPATDEVLVCVCDQRRGAYFEIRPGTGHALDAFYHPYSYTSVRTLYFEDERMAA